MSKFTIIAYRANFVTYNDVRHPSKFVFETNLSEEELVKIWSDLLTEAEIDYKYDNIHIIKDGFHVWDRNYFCEIYNEYDENWEEIEKQNKENNQLMTGLKIKATAIKDKKVQEKKEKEQAEHTAKNQKQELAEKAKRQKQYEDLRKEFEQSVETTNEADLEDICRKHSIGCCCNYCERLIKWRETKELNDG